VNITEVCSYRNDWWRLRVRKWHRDELSLGYPGLPHSFSGYHLQLGRAVRSASLNNPVIQISVGLMFVTDIVVSMLKRSGNYIYRMAVPWLRRLVAGLSPRRSGFDPGSVHVGFVVDKVALGQVFPRVLRFSPVNFIPPVLYYAENLIIFITGLQNKPQGCGASVASAAGPFYTKKNQYIYIYRML
jgi:hypothetical protein